MLCAVFFFQLLALISASDDAVVKGEAGKKMDEYMKVWADNVRFSGAVLVAHKGELILKKGYGKADWQFSVPNNAECKFRIASMTKAFTAMGIVQLQEQGKLSVNDKVSKYVPQMKYGDKMTIKDLLRMNSGLPDFCNFPDFDMTIGRKFLSPEENIAIIKDVELLFEPGTRYLYANSNYIILAYILEKVSGEKYPEYLRKHILIPAGMNNTGVEDNYSIIENLAYPYRLNYFNKVEKALFIDMTAPFGSGDMYSTVGDLYLWDRVLYTEKLAGKKSMEEIFTSGIAGPGPDAFFCYGWVYKQSKYGRVYMYEGGICGGNSFIARFTDRDVCITVLANFEDASVSMIMGNLAEILFEGKTALPVFHKVIELDRKILESYTGEYKMTDGTIVKVLMKDDRLFAAIGTSEIAIFPETETDFYSKRGIEAFLFHRTPEGKASAVTLVRENSEKVNALKIK